MTRTKPDVYLPLGEWTIVKMISYGSGKVYYQLKCDECENQHYQYEIMDEKIKSCNKCGKAIPDEVLGFLVICRAS